MGADISGHYAVLGVSSGASLAEIKAAYRRLAKDHHPDAAGVSDGGVHFLRIGEAYSVLVNPSTRAEYDSQCATGQQSAGRSSEPPKIDPIVCSRCRQVTAQPRYVVFRQVVSFILATYRSPVQGIFCAGCAKKAAIRSTLVSALFGWWGFPWGPIFTISEGFKNAGGGEWSPENEDRLLWHNAMAFGSRGNFKLAFALAQKVAAKSRGEFAAGATDLIERMKANGLDFASEKLKDPWKGQHGWAVAQIAMISAAPLALALLIVSMNESTGNSAVSGSSLAMGAPYSPPPSQSTTPTSVPANLAASVPICKRKLANGAQLEGKRPLKEGHAVEISNGSGGDAIIKIRRWPSKKLVASFLVRSNETGRFSGLPDGTYFFQYAFGSAIAKNCRSFTTISAAGQFPDAETFQTKESPTLDGVQVSHSILSYTLYPVASGNVRPQSLDPAAFDAD